MSELPGPKTNNQETPPYTPDTQLRNGFAVTARFLGFLGFGLCLSLALITTGIVPLFSQFRIDMPFNVAVVFVCMLPGILGLLFGITAKARISRKPQCYCGGRQARVGDLDRCAEYCVGIGFIWNDRCFA